MERSNLYGFLAAIYREEPTAELLRRIKEPGFGAALAEAGVTLEPDLLDRPEDALIEDLAVEFTRLFIGPGDHVPPNSAVHMEGEGSVLWGASTGWVKHFIETTGFEYRSDYHDLPDHISVELEFMQELTARESEALKENDGDTLGNLRQTQKEFVRRHMAVWVPVFCDKVMARAELSFFKGMAEVTKEFIRSESRELAGMES
jgi:TorA maturation chaperone TorD